MRQPITVEVMEFDVNGAEERINAAVQAFAEYAEQLPRAKSTRSKYGLLGSAGKAISELKSGRLDRDSLIGYTLRTQEAARADQRRPDLPLSAVQALERAVDQIIQVMRSAPEAYHADILDRLDYGLFYRLRRQQLQQKETLRREWIRFLEKKYGSKEALQHAWGRDIPALDELPLPKKQALKIKRAAVEQRDVEDFYASLNTAIDDEEAA